MWVAWAGCGFGEVKMMGRPTVGFHLAVARQGCWKEREAGLWMMQLGGHCGFRVETLLVERLK